MRGLSAVLLCMTALTVNACREHPASVRVGSASGAEASASPGANDTTSVTNGGEASAASANTTVEGPASDRVQGEGVTRTDPAKEIAPAVLKQQLAEARKLAAAMEAYARDHGGRYPSAADMAGLQAVLVPEYMPAAPQTPFDVSSTPDGYTINTITGTKLLSAHR